MCVCAYVRLSDWQQWKCVGTVVIAKNAAAYVLPVLYILARKVHVLVDGERLSCQQGAAVQQF